MTAPVKIRASAHPLAPDPTGHAGFVLYVGLRDDLPTGLGDLAEVAEALRDLVRDLLPTAETFTALSLVPRATAPDDVRTLRERLTHLRPLESGAEDAR